MSKSGNDGKLSIIARNRAECAAAGGGKTYEESKRNAKMHEKGGKNEFCITLNAKLRKIKLITN